MEIISQETGIQHQHQIVPVANLAHLAQVGQRKWLSTDQIAAGFHTHKGDLLLTFPLPGPL
jgi:hypothetical protein